MTIQTEIIGRALHWIDSEWEAGRLDAADEHLASAICERQLDNRPRLPRVAPKPTALRPPDPARRDPRRGDEAELKLAADALGAAGYETVFLGTDVPTETLEAATGTHRPGAVCLDVAADRGARRTPSSTATIERLAATEEPPLVLVGGGALRRRSYRRDGAIPVSSAEDALEVLARAALA